MTHAESIKRRKGKEIPFGIRAIESGIEVDGVWISRPNTPTQSSPEITASSRINEPSSSEDTQRSHESSPIFNIPRLEMPQPVHGYSDATQNKSDTVPGAPGYRHEHGMSPETRPNRDISPGPEYVRGGRITYEPRRSSHLKYSDPYTVSNPGTLDALEGRQAQTNLSSQGSEGKVTVCLRAISGEADEHEVLIGHRSRD